MATYQVGDLVEYALGRWGRRAKHRPARVEAVHAHELLLRPPGGRLVSIILGGRRRNGHVRPLHGARAEAAEHAETCAQLCYLLGGPPAMGEPDLAQVVLLWTKRAAEIEAQAGEAIDGRTKAIVATLRREADALVRVEDEEDEKIQEVRKGHGLRGSGVFEVKNPKDMEELISFLKGLAESRAAKKPPEAQPA